MDAQAKVKNKCWAAKQQYILMYIHCFLGAAMIETKIAKLFKNGASQAVRLPADFRFEGDQIYASRMGASGDIVLSRRPGTLAWQAFFELVHSIEVPAEFMAQRELNSPPASVGVFDSPVVSPDRRDSEHPIVGAP